MMLGLIRTDGARSRGVSLKTISPITTAFMTLAKAVCNQPSPVAFRQTVFCSAKFSGFKNALCQSCRIHS